MFVGVFVVCGVGVGMMVGFLCLNVFVFVIVFYGILCVGVIVIIINLFYIVEEIVN